MTPPGIEALPNGEWVVEGDTHFTVWSKAKGTIITDPNLFQWLKPRLEGVKVVFDCGANIGDHTRWYLNQGFEVFAFEPNPVAFQCLEHNCPEARNRQVALSDTAGVALFTQLENVGASRISPSGEIQVLTVALDDIKGLPAPDYIKLDIEGHEPFALAGMAGTITRHKPHLYVEMNRGALAANGASPGALHETILSLGYSRFEFYPRAADWTWPQFDVFYHR